MNGIVKNQWETVIPLPDTLPDILMIKTIDDKNALFICADNLDSIQRAIRDITKYKSLGSMSQDTFEEGLAILKKYEGAIMGFGRDVMLLVNDHKQFLDKYHMRLWNGDKCICRVIGEYDAFITVVAHECGTEHYIQVNVELADIKEIIEGQPQVSIFIID